MSAAADPARADLEACFRAGTEAAHGERCVSAALAGRGDELRLGGRPLPPGAGLVVIAAGKAAVPMARALEVRAAGRIRAGVCVTKDGHGGALAHLPVREAGHPVPDARSEAAGREVLAVATAARKRDVLVVLLSGGASALLSCPLPGLRREDVVRATELLLTSGAPIHELNCVRKHLLAVAGGRLARAAPAGRIEVLAISDVAGDRLDVIASGPCHPDPTTFADAVAVLRARGLWRRVPRAVRAHLEAGLRGEREETPKPGDPVFSRVHARVLANNGTALAAAEAAARDRGMRPVRVTGELAGDADRAGRLLAALARAIRTPHPVCLTAGGEPTVVVRGPGRGGRCQELALAAALALDGSPGGALLAAGTDGTDGPTDAAGAFVDGGTVARGRALGLDAAAHLARNDAYGFFAREGGLLRTGPTGTNVRDLVLVRAGGE